MNCPICLNKYNNVNKIPRILNNCGHTFCEDCLSNILTERNSNTITCAICNSDTIVEDVNLLTRNLVLLDGCIINPNSSSSSIVSVATSEANTMLSQSSKKSS